MSLDHGRWATFILASPSLVLVKSSITPPGEIKPCVNQLLKEDRDHTINWPLPSCFFPSPTPQNNTRPHIRCRWDLNSSPWKPAANTEGTTPGIWMCLYSSRKWRKEGRQLPLGSNYNRSATDDNAAQGCSAALQIQRAFGFSCCSAVGHGRLSSPWRSWGAGRCACPIGGVLASD